jgi:hypothetical protein
MNVSCSWASLFCLFDDHYLASTIQLMMIECDILNKTGVLDVRSALHKGRRFEYPWALEQTGWRNINYNYTTNTYGGGQFKDGKALDAGGGLSSFPFLLSNYYNEVYNIDLFLKEHADFLEMVKLKLNCSNITLVTRNISSLPYADNFFDDTFCISVLEHGGNNCKTIIDELLRVTKGKVIVTMDVTREKMVEYISLDELLALSRYYNFIVPSHDKNCLFFKIKNAEFAIFCICFDKGESNGP